MGGATIATATRLLQQALSAQGSIPRFAVRQLFLSRDLQFEHIRDQAVLVSQQLHHFVRGRERFHYGRIGRLTPLLA